MIRSKIQQANSIPSAFDAVRRILVIVILLTGLVMSGMVGFHYIEGWSFFDALYMSVITMTTVGYMEVHPLSQNGRIFTMVFLVIGLGIYLYGIVQVAEIMIKAQFRSWLGKRKMDTKFKSMSGHYIICGYGRMGRSVSKQLQSRKMPYVVIDRDQERIDEISEAGAVGILGDATDDAVLDAALIKKAKGIACVMENDADNLYVVMSARLLNPSLQIIARANSERGISKMQKAGANRVVCMYSAAGSKIAQLLSNPQVEDFFEVISDGDRELDVAEMQIKPESRYCGLTLRETDFTRKGVIIVGIKKASGQLALPPESDARIESGDSLIALARGGILQNFSV